MNEQEKAKRVRRITEVAEHCISIGIVSGLSYKDGIIAFKAITMVMEIIDKDPSFDDTQLAKTLLKFVQEGVSNDQTPHN